MTQHTPGPWEPSDPQGTIALLTRTHDGYKTIAVFPCSTNWYDLPREEQAANMRLCTAAPDLLAACQAVLAESERSYANKVGWIAIRDRLRAAIAKAVQP